MDSTRKVTQVGTTYERDSTLVQRPPQGGQAQSQRQRYLVGNAPPSILAALAEQCRMDPEIDLVNMLGPAHQPRLLVIETTAEHAEQLKQHAPGLIVEPDTPLHLSLRVTEP